jgi:biopolymer transport protein ExbD
MFAFQPEPQTLNPEPQLLTNESPVMKMKGGKQVHYESGPNMTPLVDIVMVILIFLMLAGSFGGESAFLVSKQAIKKSGGNGRPLKPGEVPDTPIEIRVDNSRDGLGFIATGTGLAPTGSAEQIRTWMNTKRVMFNNSGTPTSKLLVTISPSRAVKYRYLIAVYQAALQAEFEKVAFTTSH